jgi:hypothetical protein
MLRGGGRRGGWRKMPARTAEDSATEDVLPRAAERAGLRERGRRVGLAGGDRVAAAPRAGATQVVQVRGVTSPPPPPHPSPRTKRTRLVPTPVLTGHAASPLQAQARPHSIPFPPAVGVAPGASVSPAEGGGGEYGRGTRMGNGREGRGGGRARRKRLARSGLA